MPAIDPVFMVADAVPQRLIATRRALHLDPPWKPVVPQSVSTERRGVKGHV